MPVAGTVMLKYGIALIKPNFEMKILLLAISAIAYCGVAHAMSYSEAVQKILYFEVARHSAVYCEKQGVSTKKSYDNWAKKNSGGAFSGALLAIQKEASKHAASEDDQIVASALIVKEISNRAQEYVAKNGIACANFDSILLEYSRLLK